MFACEFVSVAIIVITTITIATMIAITITIWVIVVAIPHRALIIIDVLIAINNSNVSNDYNIRIIDVLKGVNINVCIDG